MAPPGDFSTLTLNPDGTFTRTYPDGTQYRFDSAGFLAAIANRFGILESVARDASHRVSSIADPAGYAISFAYDAAGRLASITTPGEGGAARTSTFTVNSYGDLTTAVDPDNVQHFSTWYINHRIQSLTDRNNAEWSWVCASDGTLDHAIAPTITARGGSTNPTTYFVPAGWQVIAAIHGGQGTQSNPVAHGLDLRAKVTNPRGYATYYTTNRWGSPTRIDYPLGPAATATYDATTGVPTQTVGQDSHTINYTWSGPDLTVISDATANRTINASYESTYHRPTHIWGNTVEQRFTYNAAYLTTSQTGTQNPDSITQDAFGRITRVRDAGGHVTASYPHADALRNTDSTVAPGGRKTAIYYDNYGRVFKTVAPDGGVDSTGYDLLNRTTSYRNAVSATTTYGYTGLYLTSITDALGQVYSFSRNALGWVESETRPGSSAITTAYDVNGNVISQTNRRGQTIMFAYDALDRDTSRTADGQTTRYAYAFPGGGVPGYVAASNAVSSDTMYVDATGRLSKPPDLARCNGVWRAALSARPAPPRSSPPSPLPLPPGS